MQNLLTTFIQLSKYKFFNHINKYKMFMNIILCIFNLLMNKVGHVVLQY